MKIDQSMNRKPKTLMSTLVSLQLCTLVRIYFVFANILIIYLAQWSIKNHTKNSHRFKIQLLRSLIDQETSKIQIQIVILNLLWLSNILCCWFKAFLNNLISSLKDPPCSNHKIWQHAQFSALICLCKMISMMQKSWGLAQASSWL